MNQPVKKKITALLAFFITLAIFVGLFIIGLIFFIYLLAIGVILGLILFAIGYIRGKFLMHKFKQQDQRTPEKKSPQGRIIDQEKED